MVDLFSVKVDAPFGKLLRIPLRMIPRGSTVPILFTRARGKRWIVGSGPHSCWLGFNEVRKRNLFTKMVLPGNIVFDIGANIGAYTILSSILVGPRGKVLAFEPMPENIKYLQDHITLNQLSNVQAFEIAVSDYCGTAKFDATTDRVLGSISANGNFTVQTTTIDQMVQDHGVIPNYLKIDVEGGEAAVLRGARQVLKNHRPIVFVATHSPEVHKECIGILIQNCTLSKLLAMKKMN
jgi:FkbM family methyltransferase